MVEPLTRGVASHHAGLLPAWKTLTEALFQRGLIKIVFATETLAAGINMPARTVVLSSLSKRGDDGHALLTTNSMLQVTLLPRRASLGWRAHRVSAARLAHDSGRCQTSPCGAAGSHLRTNP